MCLLIKCIIVGGLSVALGYVLGFFGILPSVVIGVCIGLIPCGD